MHFRIAIKLLLLLHLPLFSRTVELECSQNTFVPGQYYCGNDHIPNITADTLPEPGKIKSLWMESCDIHTIEPNAFAALKNLRKLNLNKYII